MDVDGDSSCSSGKRTRSQPVDHGAAPSKAPRKGGKGVPPPKGKGKGTAASSTIPMPGSNNSKETLVSLSQTDASPSGSSPSSALERLALNTPRSSSTPKGGKASGKGAVPPAKGKSKGKGVPVAPPSTAASSSPAPSVVSTGKSSSKGIPPPPASGKGIPAAPGGKGAPPAPSGGKGVFPSKGKGKGKGGKGGSTRIKVGDLPLNRRLNLKEGAKPDKMNRSIFANGFEKVKDSTKIKDDDEHLRKHFRKVDKEKKVKKTEEVEKDEVTFFSSGQIQNFRIVWSQFKNKVSIDDLVKALYNLSDFDTLDSDELTRFSCAIPPLTEMHSLSQYDGPLEKLRETERLLYPLSVLPRAPARFSALISHGKVKAIMEDQKRFQKILLTACRELKDSDFLQVVLAILMIFYCYSNFNEVPDSFDKVKIFDPMQVLEFANIKSYQMKDAPVQGYNIYHWAFEHAEKKLQHDISRAELQDEFENVHLASRLPFSDILLPLGDLKELFLSLRREYKEFPYDYCDCEICQASHPPADDSKKKKKPCDNLKQDNNALDASGNMKAMFSKIGGARHALANGGEVVAPIPEENSKSSTITPPVVIDHPEKQGFDTATETQPDTPMLDADNQTPTESGTPIPVDTLAAASVFAAAASNSEPEANSVGTSNGDSSPPPTPDKIASPVIVIPRRRGSLLGGPTEVITTSKTATPSNEPLPVENDTASVASSQPRGILKGPGGSASGSAQASRKVSFSQPGSRRASLPRGSLNMTAEEQSALIREIDHVQTVRSQLEEQLQTIRRKASVQGERGSDTAAVFENEDGTPKNEEEIRAELERLRKEKEDLKNEKKVVDEIEADLAEVKELDQELTNSLNENSLQLPDIETNISKNISAQFNRRKEDKIPILWEKLSEVAEHIEDPRARQALKDAQMYIAELIATEHEHHETRNARREARPNGQQPGITPTRRQTDPSGGMTRRRGALNPNERSNIVNELAQWQADPNHLSKVGVTLPPRGNSFGDSPGSQTSEMWVDPFRKGMSLPHPDEILRQRFGLVPCTITYKSGTFIQSWKPRKVALFGTNLAIYSDQTAMDNFKPLIVLPLFGSEMVQFSSKKASREAAAMYGDYPSGFSIILDDIYLYDGYFQEENYFYVKRHEDLKTWQKLMDEAADIPTLAWGWLQVNNGAIFKVWIYLDLDRKTICCYNNPKHFAKKPTYVSGPQFIPLQDVDIEYMSSEDLKLEGEGGFRMVYLRGDRIGQEAKLSLEADEVCDVWQEYLCGEESEKDSSPAYDPNERESFAMFPSKKDSAMMMQTRNSLSQVRPEELTTPEIDQMPKQQRPGSLVPKHHQTGPPVKSSSPEEQHTGLARLSQKQTTRIRSTSPSAPKMMETPALMALKEKLKHRPRRASITGANGEVVEEAKPRRLQHSPTITPPGSSVESPARRQISPEVKTDIIRNIIPRKVSPDVDMAQASTPVVVPVAVPVPVSTPAPPATKGGKAKGKGVPPAPGSKGKGKGVPPPPPNPSALAPLMALPDSSSEDEDSEEDKIKISTLEEANAWVKLDLGPEPGPEHDEALRNLWHIAENIRHSGITMIKMVDDSEARCFSILEFFGKTFPPRATCTTKQETIYEFFQVYSNSIKQFAQCSVDLKKKKRIPNKRALTDGDKAKPTPKKQLTPKPAPAPRRPITQLQRKISPKTPPAPPAPQKQVSQEFALARANVAANVDFSKPKPTLKELKAAKSGLNPINEGSSGSSNKFFGVQPRINVSEKPSLRSLNPEEFPPSNITNSMSEGSYSATDEESP